MPDYAPVAGFYNATGTQPSSSISLWSWNDLQPIDSGGTIAYKLPKSADYFTEFEFYNTPNWDGEGAQQITTETIDAARRFNALLPRDRPPDIAPGADGTIGFEWRDGVPDKRSYVIVDMALDG